MGRIKLKRRKRSKRVFFLFLIVSGIYISYFIISNSKFKIEDKEFSKFIVSNTFQSSNNLIDRLINKTIELYDPVRLMNEKYSDFIGDSSEKEVVLEENSPIIYLYNSHQGEEYKSETFAEFSVNPTVLMNDYILEDIFEKRGYSTLVEERSIKEILNKNNWNYASSYKASRVLMEDIISKYSSLVYFIDIHRDSLTKDKTTFTFDNKSFAKILFIVGMENNNYQGNLDFTEKINQKLNEKYPGLSKGIYKKSGVGVNGVYNQDFSPNTILVEIGGYQNTTSEVLNSCIAFAECFLEAINE